MNAGLSIPLHPLFVHGAVVLIPTAAIVSVLFVLRPQWRWVLRWPTAVVTGLAFVMLFASRITGEALAETITGNQELVERHEQLASLLTAAFVPFTAAVLVAVWTLPSTTPLPSGAGGRAARWGKAGLISTVVTVILAVLVLVFVVLAGDAGAKAVWTKP